MSRRVASACACRRGELYGRLVLTGSTISVVYPTLHYLLQVSNTRCEGLIRLVRRKPVKSFSTIERPEVRSGASCERDENLRDHIHAMWSAVAGAWGEHADYTDARGAELARRMLELSAPAAGERGLELACGA